jgi:hypothetical protein
MEAICCSGLWAKRGNVFERKRKIQVGKKLFTDWVSKRLIPDNDKNARLFHGFTQKETHSALAGMG